MNYPTGVDQQQSTAVGVYSQMEARAFAGLLAIIIIELWRGRLAGDTLRADSLKPFHFVDPNARLLRRRKHSRRRRKHTRIHRRRRQNCGSSKGVGVDWCGW